VSQLARELDISRALLQVHLRKLQAAGLVSADVEVSQDGKAMKFYEVTPFALQLTPQTIMVAAHGGCTAGKPRSTPPSLPPASASSCGSGRCTSLAQVVQQAQRASNVPREVRHERNGWSPLLDGGWFGLAVQWLPGDGVSLARVARSKMVMISRE
jgi:DNA-binding transcriptional ArsR family regulator